MPLVCIALRAGKSPEYRHAIGQAIHEQMVEVLKVPSDDQFQLITEHAPDALIYSRSYLGITHTDDIVFIQITLNQGRTVEQKQRFYDAVARSLGKSPGVRREDVFINLIEVAKENWSFGNGVAQYATPEAV
jgi:4-oxalocrotonate tautomerase